MRDVADMRWTAAAASSSLTQTFAEDPQTSTRPIGIARDARDGMRAHAPHCRGSAASSLHQPMHNLSD